MEPFLFCLLVSAIVTRVPAAIVDAYAAKKAADAGEWDWLKARAERNDARAARRAAWAERILARRRAKTAAKAAGEDPKRAGLGTVLGDIYHGACEDALERRKAKRAATPGLARRDDRRDRVAEWLQKKVRALADRRRATPPKAPTPDGADPKPDPEQPTPASPIIRNCPRADRHDPHVWGRGQLDCPGVDEHDTPETAPEDRPCFSPNPHPPHTWGSQAQWFRCPGVHEASEADLDPSVNDAPMPRPQQPAPNSDPGGNDMTAPSTAGPSAEEVHTNEEARRNFDQIAEGARELAEAAALAERARAKMAAAANASVDGMAATRFDAGATAAAAEAADAVSTGTLSDWCEKAEAAGSAAAAGKKSLEKYRDAEEVVAENNVDGSTLEPTAS